MSELVEMYQIPMVKRGAAEHWLKRAEEESERSTAFDEWSMKNVPESPDDDISGDGIKVTVVTCCLLSGGAEHQSVALAVELKNLGFDVTVLNTGASAGIHQPLYAKIKKEGLKYSEFPKLEGQEAVIWWGASLEPFFAHGGKVKNSIFVAHSGGKWTQDAIDKIASYIDFGVGVCGPAAQIIKASSSSDAIAIWNGVDEKQFENCAYDPGRGDTSADFIVGYMGRYSPEKNPIAAMGALKHMPGNVRLRLQGWGHMRGDFFNVIGEYNIEERVDIGGVIKDKARAFAGLDCLVVPSVTEGFPLVVAEAMLAGVPCVVTPNGDLPLVCKDGVRGIIIKGNEYSIAAGIMRLVDSATLRKKISEKGRAFALEHLTSKVMGLRYAKLILGLL